MVRLEIIRLSRPLVVKHLSLSLECSQFALPRDARAGSGPEGFSCKFSEGTSRKSRLPECRMLSTPNFGRALFCNNSIKSLVFFHSSKTFYFANMENALIHFLTLRHLCRRRSRMPVRALIVIHLSLSTPLITTPQPLLPLFLEMCCCVQIRA